MKKFCKTEFSSKALMRLYIDLKKLSEYTEKESDALCGYISMTEEIYGKCFETALSICDLETIDRLAETFPEFSKK